MSRFPSATTSRPTRGESVELWPGASRNATERSSRRWRAFNAALPGRPNAPEDPEAAARLRSLGYVTGDAPLKARYTESDDPKTLVADRSEPHRGVDSVYRNAATTRRFRPTRASFAQRP